MMRFSIYIALSLLFSSFALAQSTQTRLNTFSAGTTRIAGTGVQLKGNIGQPFNGITSSQVGGPRIITGTWRQISRLGGTPTSIDKPIPSDQAVPFEFWVAQNYPNPFNPTTVIPFSLEKQGIGELRIMNLLGQTIRQIDLSGYAPGIHNLEWDGRNDFGNPVASGPLFYRVTTAEHSVIHRMLLLK